MKYVCNLNQDEKTKTLWKESEHSAQMLADRAKMLHGQLKNVLRDTEHCRKNFWKDLEFRMRELGQWPEYDEETHHLEISPENGQLFIMKKEPNPLKALADLLGK